MSSNTPNILPMGGTDCFFLAIEDMMLRAGQGMFLSQTVVELQGTPDSNSVVEALDQLTQLHPAWNWQPRYIALFRPPRFATSSTPAATIPFQIHEEATLGKSIETFCADCLNYRKEQFDSEGYTNLRCDLINRPNETSIFIITWRHNVFDAGGADLLLREIASLADSGKTCIDYSTEPNNRAAQKNISIAGHISASAPMRRYLTECMQNNRFSSFCGISPRGGRNRLHRITLDHEDTTSIDQKVRQKFGLFASLYYQACATKAHHLLWQERGENPDAYFMSLPVSHRKPGVNGPLFQNNISFLFYHTKAAIAHTVPDLCETFYQQQNHSLREQLDESFLHLQHLMRCLPPTLYANFLRRKMQGFNSFLHSETGEVADGVHSLAGANILNAWHAPVVFSPPGTGLFLSRKSGRLSLLTTWREEIISDEEQQFLSSAFLSALREG